MYKYHSFCNSNYKLWISIVFKIFVKLFEIQKLLLPLENIDSSPYLHSTRSIKYFFNKWRNRPKPLHLVNTANISIWARPTRACFKNKKPSSQTIKTFADFIHAHKSRKPIRMPPSYVNDQWSTLSPAIYQPNHDRSNGKGRGKHVDCFPQS